MTVYRRAGSRIGAGQRFWSRDRVPIRPTLRLRFTLLNGILFVGSAALLILLAWLLIGDTLRSAAALEKDSHVVLIGGKAQSAADWQDHLISSTRQALLVNGFIAVLAVSVVGVAGAYVVAGRALRPLQNVTSTARQLSEDTLDQRIHYVGADDEVAELAATFDAMLDRISTAFDTQKRFVANASHELRTPLTVMRTEIDVTIADPDADVAEFRRMARVVRDGSERANALVDALLVLASSEAQAGRRLSKKMPADLATGVTSALSAIRRESERIGLQIETDLAPAPVVGDPGLLERLAGNLVENAVRYNHLHGQIWVRTGSDAGHCWLVVKNTGFEVDPADVAGLFEPFRRGGRERTGSRGSGLGLSIVRAIAEAHGGTAAATANPDGGLEVTITLPSAATTPVVAATAPVPLPAR
jgi:signal transduction histidine kinase